MESVRLEPEPLRGVGGSAQSGPRVRVSEGALLVIPGRPQARLRDSAGRPLRAGARYLDLVRRLARRQFGGSVLHQNGMLPLRLELYYALADDGLVGEIRSVPVVWHLHNIPRADTAQGIILSGLVGTLYSHAAQVEPLTVLRQVLSVRESIAQFGRGCRGGAAVVRYG